MERIKSKILSKPYLFYLAASGIGIVIIFLLDLGDIDFSFHDIIVEAHGLIYDLIFFGILIAIYDSSRNKKNQIDRLKEEIEDYRKWEKEEATHKILGNIRRLSDLGVTEFNLNECYLKNADLSDYNFTNSYFSLAKMNNSSLVRSNLQNTKMIATNLENSYLTKTSLENANLEYANLKETKLTLTNFKNANLSSTNFAKAIIVCCDFEGANMFKIKLNGTLVDEIEWINNLKKNRVKGANKIKKRFYVDEKSNFTENDISFYIIKKRERKKKK